MTNHISNGSVRLVEISVQNLWEICKLSDTLSHGQRNCVASNAYSVAEAHFLPENAWFKAIYADEKPVGFIMVDIAPKDLPAALNDEGANSVFLWRFMIGGEYQGKGYGKAALDIVSEKFKEEGKHIFYTSCVVEEAEGPFPFYIKYGFEDTGVLEDDEEILRIKWTE